MSEWINKLSNQNQWSNIFSHVPEHQGVKAATFPKKFFSLTITSYSIFIAKDSSKPARDRGRSLNKAMLVIWFRCPGQGLGWWNVRGESKHPFTEVSSCSSWLRRLTLDTAIWCPPEMVCNISSALVTLYRPRTHSRDLKNFYGHPQPTNAHETFLL